MESTLSLPSKKEKENVMSSLTPRMIVKGLDS